MPIHIDGDLLSPESRCHGSFARLAGRLPSDGGYFGGIRST